MEIENYIFIGCVWETIPLFFYLFFVSGVGFLLAYTIYKIFNKLF